ncbi:alpha-2-macroglobulin [Legionella dresdenensis]|uniref:Alpha-2-macroglobulin n=1 Tax=Legionella dresdenensis TaxID=450200 RepID=A0ABV8CBI5_9GAMM
MKNKFASRIIAALSNSFSFLFGRWQWSSPPWLNALQSKAAARPQLFSGIAALAVLLAGLAVYGYHWYSNLPKPHLVAAAITEPKISAIEDEELIPDNLTIDFGYDEEEFNPQSVAPLQAIGKQVEHGIRIEPAIAGKWVWETDSKLVFTPNDDWPAGQTYTVEFGDNFFASGTKMEKMSWQFSTLPFQLHIKELKFYQDPANPAIQQAVATVDFNYPVDGKSLEKNTSLILQAIKNGKQDLNARHYKFQIDYDKFMRTAYIKSEHLTLEDTARYLVLTLDKGIKSASETAKTADAVTKNLLLPDRAGLFKVTVIDASIVRNQQDRPEQVLSIETSIGVNESQINKAVHIYALPKNYPATSMEKEKENYDWQNPGEVTGKILSLSTPIKLQAIPAEQNFAALHSYRFNAKAPGYLYVKVDQGIEGFGGYPLSNSYAAVIKVPEYPKEIGFMYKGALLALSGEKKVSVLVRGLPAVKFQIARVLPDNVNQLVTQTQGDFNNPYFINQSFNQQNISELFSEVREFNNSDPSKQQYTALDLEKYLTTAQNPNGPKGLFLLQATGWDTANNISLDVKSNRLILITDLALLVKDNNDGSHDVFVQSITKGAPVANAAVSVLGKNGLPILTRSTDEQGRVNFPGLKDFIDDREPVVYLAALGNDVSFMPYSNYNRQLNYSRYDIGGVYSNYNADYGNLSAYLFSDRGIYRPGDTTHLAMIIKQSYARPQPPGLPLEATITDPRGVVVFDQKMTLNETGYLSLDFTTGAASATGQYQVNLYTVKDQQQQALLGSTSFKVAEFQPDRMRINAAFSQPAGQGWLSPTDLSANVSLWNLYGAPASDRKVSARIILTPGRLEFDQYPNYVFADPLLDPKKPLKSFSEDLKDGQTDDKGNAGFALNLERFEKASYQLTFYAEGFEAEGGRSVAAQISALVSPLDYLVGVKPDGDLAYVKQNSQRSVSFIAINKQLQKQDVTGLKIQLIALQPVSTLVKKPDGTYQYQSIVQSRIIDSKPFVINGEGVNYPLPTETIGDFALTVVDANQNELNTLKYSVVGASQQAMAKNAELTVKLNKTEFNAGDDIELQITSPYTGAGLITIERDKVYAVQWFKTDMTNSVQTIHIPADFQGNGYVNVAFVRDWNSPEIFISPLSYSITPFTISNANQDIDIALDVPAVARPGDSLAIKYKADKAGKIIVYAVDEGILQAARYEMPEPLAFFFQKRALEVQTQQTVDQILPKYIQERELSSVGGDDGEEMLANHLNPFKRKTDLPVVYWSGIIDVDTNERELSYQVPDYFNGTLTVMAVAASSDAVGSMEKQLQIRGDFIINPNVPTFVSPGDEFEVTASVANNVKDSGKAAVNIELIASPELEIIDPALQAVMIDEGREQAVRFKVRAKATPGSAKLTFKASLGEKSGTIDSTLSVRPATVYSTTVRADSTSDRNKAIALDRVLYPQYRNVEVAVSTSPLILVAGLQRYLDNFPYGCTEQLTSKAMPLLAMANQPWFAGDKAAIAEKVNATIQLIGQRQMSSGAFSYWPTTGENSSNTFATLYAMNFLIDAREQGFSVPADMLSAGISYMKNIAAQNTIDLDQAREQAYAIYLLTRSEIVTTNYLTNLQLFLQQMKDRDWQENIIGAYIAATYELLQNRAEADRLIDLYQIKAQDGEYSDFYNAGIENAQYLYLVARHFSDRLNDLGKPLVSSLVSAINSNEMNTVLSGYASLALGAYGDDVRAAGGAPITISEIFADKQKKIVSEGADLYQKAVIDNKVTQVVIANPEQQNYFYQLIQSGFDQKLPNEALKQGMEVYREYQNNDGNIINQANLGEEIVVRIQARSLDSHYLSNIAIVDLLPGGFEVVADSLKNTSLDYVDVREDRVIFFTNLADQAREITYRIKPVNTGKFVVPAIYAESMYNPAIKAYGTTESIVVRKP